MPRVLLFYHYFYPDNVVSAQHFTDLATGLIGKGWEVMAYASNRGCRDETQKYPRRSNFKSVNIRRFWRPPIRQSSSIGRIVNALWINIVWSIAALQYRKFPNLDALIVGTDPVLSVLVVQVWKLFRPHTQLVHWCFDLYPEAAIADGVIGSGSLVARIVQKMLARAYKALDAIVDIGPCMQALLMGYAPKARYSTITPWALSEPLAFPQADPGERLELFGDSKIGLLYSGNLGRAHQYDAFLRLSTLLDPGEFKIAFSVRGNCAQSFWEAVDESVHHISEASFVPVNRLEARLCAADIHLVSLKENWTGTVVPSKFFGALAVGRPVLFYGSMDSALAQWIQAYEVGWVLTDDHVQEVAEQLTALRREPQKLSSIKRHCFDVYQAHFSRSAMIDRWDTLLRELLQA